MRDRSTALTLACLGLAALLFSTCRTASPQAQLLQADAPRLPLAGATEAQVTQLVGGNNALAYDLYQILATGGTSNLAYSPGLILFSGRMLNPGVG